MFSRAARFFTEAGAPTVVLGVLPVVFSVGTAPTLAGGIVWAVVSASFFGVLPFLYIRRGVRAGRLTDQHVGRREQRTGVLLVALGSMLVGFTVLVVGHAPRALTAFLASTMIEALVALLITRVWKISLHSWVAAAGATALVVIFGRWALIAWPFMAAIGWSRIKLHDHTLIQVAAGTAAGLVTTAVLLPLLR